MSDEKICGLTLDEIELGFREEERHVKARSDLQSDIAEGLVKECRRLRALLACSSEPSHAGTISPSLPLSSDPQSTGWRDISSAPKDGTEVLVYGIGARRVSWWNQGWFHGFSTRAPTHWMPLPSAPVGSGASENTPGVCPPLQS